MSEQTADLVEDEVADAVDVPESPEEPEVEDLVTEEDAEESEESEEDQEPEYDEIDLGGNALRVPKGTVPEDVLSEVEKFAKGTWSDYSRKSGEIAERSKALEQTEKALEKLSTLNDDALQTYSRGLAIKEELAQLQNVDLNAMWQSEPDRARQYSDLISQKQAQLQSTIAEVSQKESQLVQAQQDELARRQSEGEAIVERRVKGFNADAVKEYVVSTYGDVGISPESAAMWGLNPATAIMAHKAMLYDQMQAKAKKPAPKPKAEPVKPMKAAGKTGSRPFDPVRDADKMSMEEWAKRERARLAKKAG